MSALATYTLPAGRLREALGRLLDGAEEVIGPRRIPPGDVFFDVIQSTEELELEYGNSLVSPVSWVFPVVEEVFRVLPGEPPRLEQPPAENSRLLLGIRPCDLAALQRLDQFFLEGDFEDDLYASRRSRTLTVALACATRADPRCFCSCCDTGPYAKEGYDLQLSQVGDTYLVEVGSEAGASLAERWGDLLAPGGESLIAERERQAQELYADLEQKGNMPAAIRRITGEAIPAALWERIGSRCLGCGGCSFVCPVCSCFYTTDHVFPDGTVQRLRAWDSCRLSGYTREAGGHNPRPHRSQRAERFCYHKLSYRCIERQGSQGCVGCGRCVTVCFGGVHMPAVTEMIRREA
jgi:ferredoxin